MNTEITDKKAERLGRGVECLTPVPEPRGSVLYDGACNICKGLARRWGPALARRGFACVPLQTPWVRERLNLSEDELMLEMRVLEPSGRVIGGAAAVLLLARRFWWVLPLVWLAKLPGVFRLLNAAYRWGAARRYCVNRACAVHLNGAGAGRLLTRAALSISQPSDLIRAARVSKRPSLTAYSKPLVFLLPLCVLPLTGKVPPWVFMWATAGALWLALKVFTVLEVPVRPLGRSIVYLLGWPGMDAREVFGTATPIKPITRHCLLATLNIAAGLALIYACAPVAYAFSPLLAGWVGMTGIVLVLHFGIFKCLLLVWRALGIPATPIMDAPLRSRSLSEFWGRWNTGFSIPARRYLMEPIARKFGTTAGVLTVFLVSGLVHELVISIPAKAGYGLPTLYFLSQGAALAWERKIGTNRLLTLVWAAVPAFILFHPPFVYRVMLPFLKVIGAL